MNVPGSRRSISIQGVEVEIWEQGAGEALLYLHGDSGIEQDAPSLALLSERFRVIAPSHPGFGRSSLPEAFDNVDDLAFFYLDLIDELHLDAVTLLGASFGGWIAAEIAVRCCHKLKRLVLVAPTGIKVGDRETRDIADVFALSQAKVDELSFHNPSAAPRPDTAALTDEDLATIARNRETLALFTWEPYAHNPRLRQRLHRISVPTLLLWGESDGIVTREYGEAYRDSIPGARLEVIAAAGHLPQYEQPAALVDRVLAFTART